MLGKLWKIEWMRYLMIGGATTGINFLVHFLCRVYLYTNVNTAIIVSWIASILFSFFANKYFVFYKKNVSNQISKEFFFFLGARVSSLGIELFLMFILFTELHLVEIISKVATQIVIIVINYFFSKWIFK